MRVACRSLALTALAALVIAGCGSGSTKPKQAPAVQAVSTVVKHYLSALASGNGAAACKLMTKRYQAKVVSGSPSDCVNAFNTLAYQLDASEKATLMDARIESATVTGDKASVRVRGQKGAAALTRTRGGWLISGGTTSG